MFSVQQIITMWCQTVFVAVLISITYARLVEIPNLGAIEGTSSTTVWTKKVVYEFLGIRYAVAPTANTRFKEAEKVGSWGANVLNTTQYGRACPQPGLADDARLQSLSVWYDLETKLVPLAGENPEDCLTLNVFTRNTNTTDKLPVLVFFHGGAFILGSTASHLPGFLLEEDIILVTPQYRLGAFGFFQLNSAEAPGNVGLADQIMALQWVKDNIAAFGGDPTRVTISGSSAGAASVSLLMISARAKGLFQGVVSLSGSALASWAVDAKNGELHSRQVAKLTNCTENVSLLTCMRQATVDSITKSTLQYSMSEHAAGRLGMGSYTPTVQTKSVSAIITEEPHVTYESGSYIADKEKAVPLLMGVNRHEGIFFLDMLYQFYMEPNNKTLNATFLKEDFIPLILQLANITDVSRVISNSILKNHFHANDVGNFTRMTPGLIDLTGSLLLKGPSLQQTKFHSRFAKTFLYTFDYYGQYSQYAKTVKSLPIEGGITHGDDTLYIFPRPKFPLNKADTGVAKRMVKYITNFVKYGDPTPANMTDKLTRWPAYTYAKGEFMSLSNNEETRVLKDFESTFTIAKDKGLNAATISSKLSVSIFTFVILCIIL